MKVIGIIVEYNPLHNGHEYQIQIAKQYYGADYVVLVMTGNYNERGLPAIIPKENRARMGIKAGADLVIELPTCYSLADLPGMAMGAVAIFDKIGIIDNLLFGTELGHLDEIRALSEITQTREYITAYKDCYRKIQISSKSREEALKKIGHEEYAGLINCPNNLLGITYLQVLEKRQSRIVPITHKRIGQAYLDDSASIEHRNRNYASATAVRKMIKDSFMETGTLADGIRTCVPGYVYDDMLSSYNTTFPIFDSDFSELILASIKSRSVKDLEKIDGVDRELAEELVCKSMGAPCFDVFDREIRKRFPNVNISRRYYRILTNQEASKISEYVKQGVVFYAHVLAARNNAKSLFDKMQNESRIPVFQDECRIPTMKKIGLEQLKNNQNADALFNKALNKKFRRAVNE